MKIDISHGIGVSTFYNAFKIGFNCNQDNILLKTLFNQVIIEM